MHASASAATDLPQAPTQPPLQPPMQPSMQRARGRVEIAVKQHRGSTALERFVQSGCGKARLPRIGQRRADQAVLINTSGGITGGDHMQWKIEVGDGATFTSTTQACEKVYRASEADPPAKVDTQIEVGAGATLHWLPQETILFEGAKLDRRIHINLASDARLLMVEPVMFGRLAMGETMRSGHFSDLWRIRRDGRLIHAEGFKVAGDVQRHLNRPFAMAHNAAMATLALFGDHAEDQVDRLRTAVPPDSCTAFAATAWNGKLIARFIAPDSYTLRKSLLPAIAALTDGDGVPKVWAL